MLTNQLSSRRRALLVWAGAIVLVAVIGLWLRAGDTAARAGSPPPERPQFSGQAVSESYPVDGLSDRPVVHAPTQATDWMILLEEDWEDGVDTTVWTTIDRNGAEDGEYKWADRAVANPLNTGLRSAWSIGGGADGETRDPADGGYPRGVDSWLIYGPFDLSGASEAELSFNYSFEADADDVFSVLVSNDGANWTGSQSDQGGDGTWLERNYSLDTYAGQAMVYLAFRFVSNTTGDNAKNAAFVDDIAIRGNFGSRLYLPHIQLQPTPTATATPVPTATPTPTATPPAGHFEDNFSSDIDGWAVRRSNTGTSFSLNHRDDSDGNRQGALEMLVYDNFSFALVSPLVPAEQPPYNIEVVAKLKETKDRHMYGIVFGGDWNGSSCAPAMPSSCFNRYYELRVQYRKFDGKEFQELKLKRIDGHDANGEPFGETLQDWIKGGNVGADDWVEIDIYVQANGIMTLYWNGKYIAEVQDDILIDQPYFGLLLITRDFGNARVKYDYIKID